jgi:multidrug efflux pump subunit AcrB
MATELQAIRGTVSSIAVSLAFAVFATLIFTGDVFVALMALLSMLAIILAVIAILVALKVKFGIVEAISLTILVGISVDFSLHLAESFTRSHFTSRGLRGVDAVSRVGYPIFSAAMTTMSAVIPMLWCQVQVLVRFGQIIPLCIVMSLVYGVHFFLPMLMSFGPNVPGGGAGKWLCHMGKLPGLLFSTQTRRMIFLVASGMIFGFLLPATRALLYEDGGSAFAVVAGGFAFLSAVAVFVERRCHLRAVAAADPSARSHVARAARLAAARLAVPAPRPRPVDARPSPLPSRA